MTAELDELLSLARTVADEARALLRDVRPQRVEAKRNPRDLVTEWDTTHTGCSFGSPAEVVSPWSNVRTNAPQPDRAAGMAANLRANFPRALTSASWARASRP